MPQLGWLETLGNVVAVGEQQFVCGKGLLVAPSLREVTAAGRAQVAVLGLALG